MKAFILIILILCMNLETHAAPILNENYAQLELITVYRDNIDPNVYFYAPNHIGVCRTKEGIPRLRLIDLPTEHDGTSLMVWSTMCLEYADRLQSALDRIRRDNPNARFAGIAFSSSKMILKSSVLSPLISNSDCDHVGGVIGAEQSCAFTLNSRGRRIFKETINAGIAVLIKFEYSIKGVNRTATGFENATSTFSVAGRIDGRDIPKLKEKVEQQ